MLQLQKHLDVETIRPNFVSISIDPDYDTAVVMKDYAERFGANWTFLTGSPDEVLTALRAFDAYRGNKVNHFALTLMHAPDENNWTRIEGLTSAEDLARLWRETAN
jgi:protein SCO1/2